MRVSGASLGVSLIGRLKIFNDFDDLEGEILLFVPLERFGAVGENERDFVFSRIETNFLLRDVIGDYEITSFTKALITGIVFDVFGFGRESNQRPGEVHFVPS